MDKVARFFRKSYLCLTVLSLLLIFFQEGVAQPNAAQPTTSDVGATQSSPHRISLQFGYQRYATSEPILSPLHYQGSYRLWQPSYTYRGERSYHRLQLSRIEDELTSSVASSDEFDRQGYIDLFGVQLQYTFLRKLRKYTHWTLWVGGTLEFTYFDKESSYIYDWDGRAADGFIAPSPAVAGTVQLGKHHRLRGQFSITPLAYVAGRTYASNRPPLEMIGQELTVGNALRYGDWLTFINFINLRGELMYGYSLGKHWELQLAYGFQYYHYDKLGPFDVRSVINTLLMGISFSL
ncbi:MAG: hypothetical protein WBA23_17680 [Tunicatimonas sp.]|uniref:hypothetical protein n=1 Tax=Tunicatimonas sp. TaxID=1940096 RepID=UPI003C739D3D